MPLEETSPLCGFCVGESYLQKEIRRRGTVAICAVCGLSRRTWLVGRLAAEVDDVYRRLYSPVFGEAPEGSFPLDIISEMLESDDPEIPEAVLEVLHQGEFHAVADGEDSMYDQGSYYVMAELYAWELDHTWDEFRRRVQYEQRFFDQTAKAMLDEMLAPIRALDQLGVDGPVVNLNAGDDTRVYRARVARNRQEADRFLNDPAKELSAPHPRIGRPGRLNPMGMPVFYGAFSRKTCIAEVRPPVGSFVVTAAFRVTRPIRLLDLTAFERHWPLRSMFDLGFEDDIARWQFLAGFQRLVSEPVHPAEEAMEYIPTQAVADYIYFELGFHGVIYPSAQAESDPWSEEPFTHQNVAVLRVASPEDLFGPTTFERELESIMRVPMIGRPRIPAAEPEEPEQGSGDPPLLEYVDKSAELRVIRGVEFDDGPDWYA